MNRIQSSQRKIPGTSFTLNFSINFPVSASNKLHTAFKNAIKIKKEKYNSSSRYLKREYLKLFEIDKRPIKNESDLLKINKNISKALLLLKKEIIDESPLDTKEFPEWGRQKMQAVIKEVEKNGEKSNKN